MRPEQADYIRYRVARAEEAIREARLLLENGHLNTAVNRLYYACFYAVSGLLLSEGHHSSRHRGVHALFVQHWIKNGRLSVETGHFYRQLLKRRLQSDYSDLIDFNRDDVEAWLQESEKFINAVSNQIEQALCENAQE